MQMGFSEKEAIVYLALLEFGAQPASVISKKLDIPRPTVLFLFQALVKRGVVRKSMRGRTQIFFADPNDLEEKKRQEIAVQSSGLEQTIKLLKEFKNPLTSQPKVTFFEGIDGCRKAYSMILESKTEALEFGTHRDLEKMGVPFMENFIKERAKRKIMLYDLDKDEKLNRNFQKRDLKDFRHLKIYDAKKFGNIYSSINIFEDKVLLLNLHEDAFAILIENHAVAETLKTIFRLSWNPLPKNPYL